VPVTPSELDALDVHAGVQVARLGLPGRSEDLARPVTAPPSADPLGATVDVFYALDPAASTFHPGERVEVELIHRDAVVTASVPASAVIHDFDGGAWVYACVDANHFRRVRVEVLRVRDDRAVIGRGPEVGSCVVTVGALELFGTELGVAH
jgi:multidrug efflux pump subunit AcrA (membrane-fusion protein)